MKKLLVALLGKPKLEAAISVTAAELKKVIKWAIDSDQPTKVVNRLKKIQKAKERPALGKDTPKGTDKITKLTPLPKRYGYEMFTFEGKTGSAAIAAYRKNPISRSSFLDQTKNQAIEKLDKLNLTPTQRREGLEEMEGMANLYWEKLHKAANPSTVSSKELIDKPYLDAAIKAAKQKGKPIDNLDAAIKAAKQKGKPIDKKKLRESMAGKIMDTANKQIDLAYERMIKDKKQGPKEVLREQQLARAKFKKPKVPKGKTKAESFASRKEPDPKKPTMQKGGAYKGKKHSYAAGGKVNKLNF